MAKYTTISTHSARKDGDLIRLSKMPRTVISTHSARKDGDLFKGIDVSYFQDFNPLRPQGRRPITRVTRLFYVIFQPTPPARTETVTDRISTL